MYLRKLWICLLLSFTVLLSLATPAAAAETTDPLHQKIIESYYSGETVNLEFWNVSVSELEFEMVREAIQEETGMVCIHCLKCDYEQWDETPKEPQTMAAELWERIDVLPMIGSVGLGVLILAAIIRKKKH